MSTSDRAILDTSTVVLLERIGDPRSLPPESLITAVTLAELSVGPCDATGPGERATRQLRLQQAEADFDPLPFDAAAARAFGRIAASVPCAGRKTGTRSHNGMIAAVGLANDLPLFTRNPAGSNTSTDWL